MSNKHQSGVRRLAKVLGLKWWQGISAITGIIALVVTVWIAESGGSSTFTPVMSGPPVRVDSVLLQPNIDQGQTFVFPKALKFSKAELRSLTNLSGLTDRSIQGPDTFYTWARNHDGVDPNQVLIQLVLSGNSTHEVRIVGMHAVGTCRSALTGTMMAYGSEGGEQSIGIGFNLDTGDPNARSYNNGNFGSDYFLNKTVSLKPNEQQAFEIIGVSRLHYCQFRIQMVVLNGTKYVTETISNGGKPFRVTGTLSPTRYAVFYGGGIANSCPPHFDWMRFDPADIRCPKS
jgi:hypothetical protein